MNHHVHIVPNHSTSCPVESALHLIEGRWKKRILYQLSLAPIRFCELQRAIKPISQAVLARQLRELEAAKLISRTVYPENQLRVEYALTALGDTLVPLLCLLRTWAENYIASEAGARA